GVGIRGGAAFRYGDRRRVLAARSGDGGDGNLRGDELPGDSADARVRDPREHGSDASRCACAGGRPGRGADRCRYVCRTRGVGGTGTTDREAALWNGSAGSTDIRGGGGSPRRRGPDRKLSSGVAGGRGAPPGGRCGTK